MLNAKDIGLLIEDPQRVTTQHLAGLDELSKKYPYAQLFSILYLKGMHSSASLDFEAALKQHSYRISDRTQLYHLINDHVEDTTSVSIDALDSTSVKVPEEKHEADILVEKREVSEESEAALELNTEEFLESEGALISDKSSDSEYVSSESEEASESDFEEADLLPIDPVVDPLEENILHHAHAANYQLDALTEDEEATLEERQSKEEHTQEELPEIEISIEPESVDSKMSFTGWLHADTNYQEQEDGQAPIRAVVEGFADFDPLESLSGEVEKPKKEFFSPSKKAKESLSETQLPVSETLARVYAMQGNYPKAIAAYNELILAFPEKKSFFAIQIEELKQKLNT